MAAGGREELVDPVLAELRAGSGTPVAVVGARSDYRLAVAVVRAGAGDYFCLPQHFGEVRAWVREQVERAESAREEARDDWIGPLRKTRRKAQRSCTTPG